MYKKVKSTLHYEKYFLSDNHGKNIFSVSNHVIENGNMCSGIFNVTINEHLYKYN